MNRVGAAYYAGARTIDWRADIGLRMLQPKELFAGQGFPPEYTFNIGNKSDQIRRVGNSVPPQFAEQLVRANLPEMCVPEHMNKYYSEAN